MWLCTVETGTETQSVPIRAPMVTRSAIRSISSNQASNDLETYIICELLLHFLHMYQFASVCMCHNFRRFLVNFGDSSLVLMAYSLLH